MKIGIIIQARMASARFPGKVLATLRGKPVIGHIVERCSQAGLPVVVATTADPSDNVLCAYLETIGAQYYRGSMWDVQSRLCAVAISHNFTRFVRVCGDCPLVDPWMIKRLVKEYDGKSDYASFKVGTLPAVKTHVGLPELVSTRHLKRMIEYRSLMKEHVTWACHSHLPQRIQWIETEGLEHSHNTVDVPADLFELEKRCEAPVCDG